MYRSSLGRLLRRAFPSAMAARSAYHFRQRVKSTFWARQCETARHLFGSEQDIIVLSGPFLGMKYFNEVVWGPIEPKWIGSYELELHQIIYKIIETDYETIIDVGSAEGYYSVGLALKLPRSSVFSFEIDPWARRQQRRLAALNQVTNLRIGGFCTYKQLELKSRGKTLVLCDIEGSETELLNPQKARSLRKVDCLVELHDTEKLSMRQVKELFLNWFEPSHNVRGIEMTERSRSALSMLGSKTAALDCELLNECRWQRQTWLWMTSRQA